MNEFGDLEEISTETMRANVISIGEVVCSLNNDILTYTTEEPTLDFVIVHDISISNDGNGFSQSRPLVQFNSQCVKCSNDGMKPICEYTVNIF